jgi:hypothetical protein
MSCRQHANEPVIYYLTQTIYDFLDEKFIFLNDEQHDPFTEDSNTTDCVKYSKRLPVPQLSPEGGLMYFSILEIINIF